MPDNKTIVLQTRVCTLNRILIFKQLLNLSQKISLRIVCSALLVISISGCEFAYRLAVVTSCNNRPDITISPEKLPIAIIDRPYQVVFSASQNGTPIAGYYLSSGQLPIGVKLVSEDHPTEDYRTTASLEGVPTEIGEFPITIGTSAFGTMCSGQSGSQEYILTVKQHNKLSKYTLQQAAPQDSDM